MPTERALTDEEHEEIQDAAMAALGRLGVEPDDATVLVEAIEARILARRSVRSDHNEEVYQLGALFAHCLAETLEWELVEVSWDTIVAHAVVTMDRSLAILPFLAVARLYDVPSESAALASSFARLLEGDRPPGLERGGYAVLLP
ncbi:MAG: hypothetical protein R3F61_25645 [Myxococcota bacterium]